MTHFETGPSAKVLLQFRHAGAPPTLEDVQALFDLRPNEIDGEFGIIATGPSDQLYSVLIEETATTRVQARLAARVPFSGEGLFGNTRIEPT